MSVQRLTNGENLLSAKKQCVQKNVDCRELVLLVVAKTGASPNTELLVFKPLVKIIGPFMFVVESSQTRPSRN